MRAQRRITRAALLLMKKLNKQATKIFSRLLRKLNNQDHVKLLSDGFMPLVIEKLQEGIQTVYGRATQYSLTHYYEQNGDAMRDPDMCFLVIDLREDLKNEEHLFIFPILFQQDNLGLYEESVVIENNKVTSYKPVWQKAHCTFANQWLLNIKHQGFLK